MVRIDLIGALLLVVFALAAGWIAARLAREPEDKLGLKGVGFMFLGAFVIWVGSVPVPALQLAGAFLASASVRNRASRLAAFGVGLVWLAVGLITSR